MTIIVEKYGGSSLATTEHINKVAENIVQTKINGHRMVIVVSATALTGAQAGIQTEGPFNNARISTINPERIIQLLDEDEIVVVTGFQGAQEDEVAVLGRGGSDATAVALATALGASRCYIYTDVQGVYTEDPNLVPTAELIRSISYEEMIEKSASGARVLMQNAVEIAQNSGVDIIVGSSYQKNEGTIISS